MKELACPRCEHRFMVVLPQEPAPKIREDLLVENLKSGRKLVSDWSVLVEILKEPKEIWYSSS